MIDFDAYLIVDWSANGKPKPGKDSIWYCMLLRDGDHLCEVGPENPATRQEAFERVASLLVENVKRHLVTLVGFDFPYGYPSGFAAALGINDKERPAWEQVWNFLSGKIQDKKNNSNNRFRVAAALNNTISSANYPFWGCPPNMTCPTLSPTKPRGQFNCLLADKRITERRTKTKKAKSVWQLFYKGAVGSQALLGIPYVARLRNHPRLAEFSQVWPFETGMRKLPERKQRSWLVLHAEIFPAIINVIPTQHEIKDAAQVLSLARHFARLDEEGELAAFFDGPDDLSDKERSLVCSEEGWILGVE